MGGAAPPAPPPQQLPMPVPAGGFDPPPYNHAAAPGAAAPPHRVVHLPHAADVSHSVRMQDAAFARMFFKLRAQNLTGLICGVIMLFVSRQSGSMPVTYVSVLIQPPSAFVSHAITGGCGCRLPPRLQLRRYRLHVPPPPPPRALNHKPELSNALDQLFPTQPRYTTPQLRAVRRLAVQLRSRVSTLHRLLQVCAPLTHHKPPAAARNYTTALS
jgi:hypothetical protein